MLWISESPEIVWRVCKEVGVQTGRGAARRLVGDREKGAKKTVTGDEG